jgi:Zn-dependent protease
MGDFVVVCAGWIFSLCLHEWGHAIVAYKGGDLSVRDKGYLTFNPVYYAHPVLSLLFPLVLLLMGGIGLPGGAVYIDRSRLRSRAWESAVSLAGPAANLVLGIVFAAPFLFVDLPEDRSGTLWPALGFLAMLQFGALVLNLIPVPPLDGYGALAPWLPPGVRASMDRAGLVGLYLVFLAMWTVPAANQAYWSGIYAVAAYFGIPADLIWDGWVSFRFWER